MIEDANAARQVINLPAQAGMTTRNPNRIPAILAALGQYWMENPDLRLGQIMGNAAITYYTEDDKALMGIEQWREWHHENRSHFKAAT